MPGGSAQQNSFSVAFLILAAVCLPATAGALRLDRAAGDVLRSARHRPAPRLDAEAS